MFRSVFRAIALAAAFWPASGYASDADAVAAAKLLAHMWSEVPSRNYIILGCEKNTLKLLRIRTERIAFDVIKSDSLVSPYKIIIDMTVSSQTNEPDKFVFVGPEAIERMRNQVCYKTIEEAKRHTTDRDFSDVYGGPAREYPSRLVYGYSDEGYRLLSAVPGMTSTIVPGAFLSPRNASIWAPLVSGR